MSEVTLEQLLQVIRTIEETNPINPDGFLYDDTAGHDELIALAGELLITDEGKPNYGAISRLPVKVGPGEVDNFGWLTGVIYTTAGKVVF